MRHLLIGLLAACGLGAAALFGPPASGAPEGPKPVDFDRDVRPILSENCFKCHGFDAGQRQAGLRLDTAQGATGKLPSGHVAIVPGKPEASLLVERTAARTMPPPGSGKKLTDAQIATLRRWVLEGARYKQHWAFVAPVRPPIPAVKLKSWPVNPIDNFVLARLESEGLKPSPAADRRTLIRRVTFDLTGLPPTPAEVNAFLNDRQPGAYERLVDRLLSSPHYGERMALQWLDLAHYADTHGYHIDSQRDMWRWRDWVIDAYNRNLPYDQFVVQQLAGDLLPHPTLDQRIATGFCRNHPIDFEGGAIPEEYAAAYIFDRIDTVATTFMGLTMRCAQCHDHKYDPITQKEYYRFYAFFHNVPEQGLDGQKGNAVPYIKAPLPGQQEQLDSLNKKAAELDAAMKARSAEAAPAYAEWEKQTAAVLKDDGGRTTDDGRIPADRVGLAAHYLLDEGSGEQVRDESGKLPVGTIHGKVDWADGKVGKAIRLDGMTYCDLGDAFNFDRTDKVSYGAWVMPSSGEAGAVLSRMDDGAMFRGWDMYLQDGRIFVHMIHEWEKNAIRVNTKSQMELNKWHHLFVTYDGSGKAKGIHVYMDGKPQDLDITHDSLTDTIHTDKPLLIGRRNPGAPFKGLVDEVRIYRRELTPAEVEQIAGFDTVRPLLAVEPSKRTKEQSQQLLTYFLEHNDAPYQKLAQEHAAAKKKAEDFDSSIPTVMVMEEMSKPRETHVLLRGQYDQLGEVVTAGVPAMLPPLPEGMPANRLALAKWLVAPNHPLTARVAVNRYWQMLFGTGLVKTSENFGTQGEEPSHPALLDWLACEFENPTEGGGRGTMGIRPSTFSHQPLTAWDVKRMLRLMVTSATYRQASRVTPELLEKDPENRLLARGPRFRLPAEFVRDQALAISGLLVPKIGGPSVKPYQPAGLWEEISFKGGFSAQFYEQDHGEALYRRSMYTFWKRTCPPPALQTFDAPEREFCMVRRSVTNTPLQALVLMNETTFVECSRKLAERILKETEGEKVLRPSESRAGGGSGGRRGEGDPSTLNPQPSTLARLSYAYELAMARAPKPEEAKVLATLLNEQLARFRKDPQAAKKLLGVGESKRDEKLDPAELAAWTTIANMILNLDETITKG